MAQALTIRLRLINARPVLAAFRGLPKEASAELREGAGKLAETLATRVRAAGRGEGRQASLLVSTVKVKRDRVPVIEVGGSKRVGRHGAPAWGVLFGSEFGADGRYGWFGAPEYGGSDGRQYKPHRGREGRWIFPTVEAEQHTINAAWEQVATDILRAWSRG